MEEALDLSFDRLLTMMILRSKKLYVSAGSGHHQVLSFDSLKIILYISLGGVFDEEISTSKPNIEVLCSNKGFVFANIGLYRSQTDHPQKWPQKR